MGWLITWFLYKRFRTGEEAWNRIARFWIGIFAVTFAVGVATGITMEFQFGTNWASYSRFVGDIFGAPLAAEGVLAFFMESIFLGVLIFGGKRLSPRASLISGFMVAFGSTLSGFWIIVANSWQQTPAGFKVAGGRAELTDFVQAVFNPSTIPRYLHTIDGALLTGAIFMMGISAWYLLKGLHLDLAKKSMTAAVSVTIVAALAQLGLGHYHAVQVAETQPAKLAAYEGLWETQKHAPLLLFGIPDEESESTRLAITLPGLLSIGVAGSSEAEIQGLKAFPKADRPPVFPTFATFHLMVAIGFYFIGFGLLGGLLLLRKRLFDYKPFLWLSIVTVPLPFIANELGWIAAEIGRQPWVVYNVLRTKDAVSATVPAGHILATIILFSAVYLLLFGLWVFLLGRKIKAGPEVAQ
jgi:cytochrome d ubiquinol oxidase subunit I